MKPILITLTALFSLISMSSFANDTNVSSKVEASFKNSFKSATEVNWTAGANFYRADFSFNGQIVAAFYNEGGEMIALTRNISSTQLPLALQTGLKKNQEGYWISSLFEIANEEGTSYYVTLENADKKLVMKSSGADWMSFQKQKKS
jgi:hypothetical protein